MIKAKGKNRTYIRIFFVVIGLFLLFEIIGIGTRYIIYKENINTILKQQTDFAKTNVDLAQTHRNELADVFYKFEIDNNTVINIMQQAAQTKSEKERDRLRKKLYNLLEPSYKYIKKYGVRQLHFHLPGTISFLRFHRPLKYGDSLIGVREDLEYVNKVKKHVSVFEEGRIFNGFRNIYPLFKKDIFVGTVEISYSFSAMENELCKADDDASYLFFLKNDVVKRKVFKEEKSNYAKSELIGYSYDKETIKDDMYLSLNQLHKINRLIVKKAQKIMQNGKEETILFHNNRVLNNQPVMITFLPVRNIEKEIVAYIVVYDVDLSTEKMQKDLYYSYFLITLAGIVFSLLTTLLLFSERKKYTMVKEFATHDALTGIYNRYRINELFDQRIAEAKRYNKPLSVIFFDIDFFKKVNDTYGHELGDVVLRAIAQQVSSELRESDIFARWGGEEFIILLPETQLEAAIKVAEKLRKKIEDYNFTDLPQHITCSFGVTQLREDDDSKRLFKRVDDLLYKAKNTGRNKIVAG